MNSYEGKFNIGTSNIVLPVTKQFFPPPYQSASRLTYYGSFFNSLEVNSTFYKLPSPSTFTRWSNQVNDDFSFSVKCPLQITHEKDLRFSPQLVQLFMRSLASFNSKKGCILIQLPAKITVAFFQQLQGLLAQLNEADGLHEWHKAVEFRDDGWYNDRVYQMLQTTGTSVVLHDMHAAQSLNIEYLQPVVYFRFHGPRADYRGSYTDDQLEQYAAQMKHLLENGKNIYAYFNNTIGSAFSNAETLDKKVMGVVSETLL